MILRQEFLSEGGLVISAFDHPNLGGWPDVDAASRELRRKAAWLDPEPLVGGGYETRKPHPGHAMRERITFWPETKPRPPPALLKTPTPEEPKT